MVRNIIENKLEVLFYRSNMGHEPVRDWLRGLSKEDKKVLGEDIKTIQFGWPLGMSVVKSLGDGLWEVRSHLKSFCIARVIFFIKNGDMILLHGFIKKSRKTSNDDMRLAIARKRNIEMGC